MRNGARDLGSIHFLVLVRRPRMVGPTMSPSFIALYAPPLILAFAIFFLLPSSSHLPGQPTPVATTSTPTTPNTNNDDFLPLSSHPSPLVVDNAAATFPKFILVFVPSASPDPPNDQVPASEGTAVFGGHDAPAEERMNEASFSPSTTSTTTITTTSPTTSATATTSPSSAKNHETFLDRQGDELESAKAVNSDTMADEHAEEEKFSTMLHRPPIEQTGGAIAHKPRPFKAYDQYMSDNGISWWLWFVYAAMTIVCSMKTKGLSPHALQEKIGAFLPDTLLLAWILAHACCLALRPVTWSIVVSAIPIVGAVALWPKMRRLCRKLGLFPLRERLTMPTSLGLWNGAVVAVFVLLLPPMMFRAAALIYLTSCMAYLRLAYSQGKRFIEQAVNKHTVRVPRDRRKRAGGYSGRLPVLTGCDCIR